MIDCFDPAGRKMAAENARATGRAACGVRDTQDSYASASVRITDLLPILSSVTGRLVLDRTGIEGRFEVELKWASASTTQDAKTDAVSIFTAVREQLGLTLESATEALDTVVIDRIDRPTAN
ncbi:MAG TPA: TIGR03435 family protein [Vicinamibacterales bacterium]|jgi:uncharacterized protein (TIGR03435 family)